MKFLQQFINALTGGGTKKQLVEFDETGKFIKAGVPNPAWEEKHANGAVYRSCKAPTLFRAAEMLRGIPSVPSETYCVVDTPDGSLGRDIWGFYTEAPLKTGGLKLETSVKKTEPAASLSLTAFGDAMKSQGTVALLKSSGQYAAFVLQMECGQCGYKSPVETTEGEFERQCYACGAVNKNQRATISVMTRSGMVKI